MTTHAYKKARTPCSPPEQRMPHVGENDHLLGLRIRHIRRLKGLSGPDLAALIALSPQQLHKYETGQNRIGALMLKRIALLLDVTANDLVGVHAAPKLPCDPVHFAGDQDAARPTCPACRNQQTGGTASVKRI